MVDFVNKDVSLLRDVMIIGLVEMVEFEDEFLIMEKGIFWSEDNWISFVCLWILCFIMLIVLKGENIVICYDFMKL